MGDENVPAVVGRDARDKSVRRTLVNYRITQLRVLNHLFAKEIANVDLGYAHGRQVASDEERIDQRCRVMELFDTKTVAQLVRLRDVGWANAAEVR